MRQRFLILCTLLGEDCDSFAVFAHDRLIRLASNNNVRDSNVHKNVLLTKKSVQSLMVC